jgi:aspartyl-tRNA(Asn)/glutamyl-tRNA(Gln) amidotransferase subunit A
VSLLRHAGAIIVGKASTHEFALGVTNPQTNNPHDRDRIPGGSSGGSAVSIATGMALGSLGTDTRASIRVPAALTGVVGFKPTFGVIPTGGVLSLSWTMDHVAPMAATVSDVAVMLDVLLGRPVSSPSVAPTARVRIGVPDATFLGMDADVDATVRDVIGELAMTEHIDVVHTVRPAARDFDVANAVGLIVSRCEAAAIHRGLALDRSRYWDEVADQLEAAEAILAVDYLDAQRLRGQLADELLEVFATVDVLAMPTAPVIAPRTDEFADYLMVLAYNAIPWSLVGFPAVSIPCGRAHGLPVGIQLVAAPHREDLLVALGVITERIVGCS